MFTIEEIESTLQLTSFLEDFKWVRQSLAYHRANQPFDFEEERFIRLCHFVESVLSSTLSWELEKVTHICKVAAEIAELLSMTTNISEEWQLRMRFRSALLYELAELPALASAVIGRDDFIGPLNDAFKRKGLFGKLKDFQKFNSSDFKYQNQTSPVINALSEDILGLVNYINGKGNIPEVQVSQILGDLAKYLSIGFSSSEILSLKNIILKRAKYATITNIDHDIFLGAKDIEFPAELWSTQVKAIKGGLLDSAFDSWGFAAPTGTGKTFLTRLLIIKALSDLPNSKILYIVPSRALVYEIVNNLNSAFEQTGYKAGLVSPQLVELENEELIRIEQFSVIVLTPEKADLLIRLGAEFFKDVSLVIIDEAHHIESGTRGALLEMYLWRVKRLLREARVIFLSAVAPNIEHLAKWMGKNPGSVTDDKRSTRMRVGVYKLKSNSGKRQGWIEYSDSTKICVLDKGVSTRIKKGIVQLAEKLVSAGPVLIVAKGKRESENLAAEMKHWLEEQGKLREISPDQKNEEIVQRLDSRLEREMYSTVSMRNLFKNRIAYHHAGLPPRVRIAVEEAIRSNLIDYVFATTTLAEGVNFPFSSVIVESIALRQPPEKGKPTRYHVVTPRSFWNIAGRAGRPGFDKEGQVILFEPSLGLDKVNAVLENYLDPSLNSIEPVHSAIANSIMEIYEGIKREDFQNTALYETILSEKLSKNIHGTINLLRVGLIHAKANNLLNTPEDIIEGSFASMYMGNEIKCFSNELIRGQAEVINNFFSSEGAPSIEMVAELGISIETLTMLRNYVSSLQNWQIENMGRMVRSGRINLDRAQYVVGPVAARMAELEGPKLGGFYSNVIIHWLSGVPLSTYELSAWDGRLENLISVIYSRIQYLLPWGLYAMDKIVEEEAKKRKIPYNNDICSLAYLADAGVPDFDALRLVGLEIERVDATRLSNFYYRKGGLTQGVDIVGWLINEKASAIENCVKGVDNRRLDYDLFTGLRQSHNSHH